MTVLSKQWASIFLQKPSDIFCFHRAVAPFMIQKCIWRSKLIDIWNFQWQGFDWVSQTLLYINTDIKYIHTWLSNYLICPLCRIPQEAELHFVLCCPLLRALRVQFFLPTFCKVPGLSIKLASSNENIHENILSVYLYNAFKLRGILSSWFKYIVISFMFIMFLFYVWL